MYILGLNFGHDGSACVVKDGKLVSFITTERVTRKKKQRGVTKEVLDYVLKAAGIAFYEIDLVALCNLYSDPFLWNWEDHGIKVENAGIGKVTEDLSRNTFVPTAMTYQGITKSTLLVNHHTSHSAYSFYSSPFKEAVSVSLDVSDETGCNNSIHYYSDNSFKILKKDSSMWLGMFYSSIVDYLGFHPSLVGAGKVMALAAYDEPHINWSSFAWPNKNKLDLNPATNLLLKFGYKLPNSYLLYPQLEGEGGEVDTVWLDKKTWKTNGATKLAATIQAIFEESVLNYLSEVSKLNISNNLCLSGGLMLNCTNNGKLLKEKLFENIFIAPACGDDGLAIGAALLVANNYGCGSSSCGTSLCLEPKEKSWFPSAYEVLNGGKTYSQEEILAALTKYELAAEIIDVPVADYVADALMDNKIIGWFYRGSEIGPRALGHRSILANPTLDSNKDLLNLKVKHREEFRPFSPVVLEEKAQDWFHIDRPSPFMLFAVQSKFPEKIPAAIHIDGTARIQTVTKEQNGSYYDLVKAFGERSGVPCLLNTSFNIQGEPIVETPEDAIKCFLGTEIDVLVLENIVVVKK